MSWSPSHLFNEWVTQINERSLRDQTSGNASFALLGILALDGDRGAPAAASRRAAGTSGRARVAAHGAGLVTAAPARSGGACRAVVPFLRADDLPLADALRVGSVLLITVVVGIAHADLVEVLAVGKPPRGRQSAGPRKRDGLVGTGPEILTTRRWAISLFPFHELGPPVEGVETGLPAQKRRPGWRRRAARGAADPLPLNDNAAVALTFEVRRGRAVADGARRFVIVVNAARVADDYLVIVGPAGPALVAIIDRVPSVPG